MALSPKVSAKILISMLLLMCLSISAYGQVIVERAWREIPGKAIEIGAGPDGLGVAIDDANNVWQWDNENNRWRNLTGRLAAIEVARNGTLWGMSPDGQIMEYVSRHWKPVGRGARNFALGEKDDLVAITNTGSLARFDIRSKKWNAIGGFASKLDVATDNWVWTVDVNNVIARQLGDSWIGLPGQAIDISIDGQGTVFIITPLGEIQKWDTVTNQWQNVRSPGRLKTISASPDGILWVTDQNGKIFVQGLAANQTFAEQQNSNNENQGGGDPAKNVDDTPFAFEEIIGTGEDLAIGTKGSVFALLSNGSLSRWSNADDEFNDFPATLDKIQVDWEDLPWGISRGNLYRHDGQAWREISVALQIEDFSLSADRRVLVTDRNDRVFELEEPYTNFKRLPGKGEQIGSAPNQEDYWLVDSRNRIFKCDPSAGCNRMSLLAEDLEIGPAGSVFIVDTDNNLRRYNAQEGLFELIEAGGIPLNGKYARIALGPKDRPWVVDTSANIYASTYFERDESKDDELASLTERTEDVTTGESGGGRGVTIINSISFTSIDVPTSASGFPSLGHGLKDLTSGDTDTVVTSSFADPCVEGTGRSWVYDAVNNEFVFLTGLENGNFQVIVNSDFAINGSSDNYQDPVGNAIVNYLIMIFPFQCTTYQLVEFDDNRFDAAAFAAQNFDSSVEVDFNNANLGLETDLDLSEDDWIVYADREGDIGFLNTQSDVFFTKKSSELTFQRIAVGANLDNLWVIDNKNNIYQLVDAATVRSQNLSTLSQLTIGNGSTSETFIPVLRSEFATDQAQDIGVGFDNTVWIVDTSGRLKKWNTTTQTFDSFNKTGVTRVAVNSEGKPITANFPDSRTIYFGR